MQETPNDTPEDKEISQLEPELEDTREFTPEEVQALGIYAEWIKHRHKMVVRAVKPGEWDGGI